MIVQTRSQKLLKVSTNRQPNSVIGMFILPSFAKIFVRSNQIWLDFIFEKQEMNKLKIGNAGKYVIIIILKGEIFCRFSY